MTETPPASIVVLSGTLHRPSKTDIVLDAVVAAVSERLTSEVQNYHALDVAHDLVEAHTLPIGVYASGADFLPDGGISERLAASIDAAATSAAAFVTQRR